MSRAAWALAAGAAALILVAGCSIHSVPADGYTSQPVNVGDQACFQITKNGTHTDTALGVYCPASPPAPVSDHACTPPLCQLVPAPETSATPYPRATPTRASRSRTPADHRTPGLASTPARGTATGSLTLNVTGYCWTGARTANGTWPHPGTAAGNRWPFGTRLRVPGTGVVTITDRIGHGSDLDIYLGHDGCDQRARHFGRRHLPVEVLS